MNLTARAPFLLASFVLALVFAGCGSSWTAEKQIRERIASIRASILAKRAEGIVEFGTPDWRFETAEGKSFDRAAYLARTTQLLAGIEIESLDTRIDSCLFSGPRAEVMLTQTMVRVETDATGTRARWKVTYREKQEWVDTPARGWLVTSVMVFHPEREKLPLP